MTALKGMNKMTEKYPRPGVSVFVIHDMHFLMMKRKGSHGEGTWALPGGGVEWGERISETVIRELQEEIGLIVSIEDVRIGPVTNDFFLGDGKHYVDIYCSVFLAEGGRPNVRIMEPDKCTELKWISGDGIWFNKEILPKPLFPSFENFLKTKVIPPFNQHDVENK